MESKIVDSYVETYIKSLLLTESGLLSEIAEYGHAHQVPIIQPEIAQYLKVFLEMYKPKSVLEIGTAIGYSGSLFAMSMTEGSLHTIEINEDMHRFASTTFEKLKAIKPEVEVHQHLGDASEVLKNIQTKFDLIFIDAAKGHYQAFFDLCYPMLSEGGVIISDNVLYKGMVAADAYVIRRKITIVKRMRKYLEFITHHPELETTILPMGDGLAISIKKGGNA